MRTIYFFSFKNLSQSMLYFVDASPFSCLMILQDEGVFLIMSHLVEEDSRPWSSSEGTWALVHVAIYKSLFAPLPIKVSTNFWKLHKTKIDF